MKQLESTVAPRRIAASSTTAAPSRWLPMPSRFNLICRIAAAFYLLAACVPIAVVRNIPRGWLVDFPQYYMGGAIALQRNWHDLYPIPDPNSLYNPGDKDASQMRPGYAQLAARRGVPNAHRFIQMPPVALMLSPLALMPYTTAAIVWVILCTLCAAGLAWIGGTFYALLCGRASYMQGLITLGIALLPSTRRALNPGNISPIVALLLALCIYSLLRWQNRRFAVCALGAGALKYTSPVLLPLLVAMHRWRAIAWLAALSIGTAVATAIVTGVEPFKQFAHILLLSNRPWLGTDSHNQAIWSLVYQFIPSNPLPGFAIVLVAAARWIVLTGIMVLAFRRHRFDWERNASQVLAGCSAMIAWLLIFSPIYWIHYILYLTPLIGWLVWEMQSSQSWRARILATAAIFFIAAPYTNGSGLLSIARQPMAFHALWAAALVLGLATRRLAVPIADTQADTIRTWTSLRAVTESRRLRPAA